MSIEQGRAEMQGCERSLRKLVAQAADNGDYPTVEQLTDWARSLARLIGESQPTSGASAGQKGRAAKRVSGRNGFPRFVRRGDELVKYGWSKAQRGEYQHRAPREMLFRLVDRLAASGSNTKIRPATAFVFEGAVDGDSLTYQFYVCLAWLRSVGLVTQHGRQGYTVSEPSKLKAAVGVAWAALKQE